MNPIPVIIVPDPDPSDPISGLGLLGALGAAAMFCWWFAFAGLFTCWIGKLAFLLLIIPVMICGWCLGASVLVVCILWALAWCFCKFVFSYSIYDVTEKYILTPIVWLFYTSGNFTRHNITPFLSQF